MSEFIKPQFDVFLTVHHKYRLVSSYQLNAHFLYSIKIHMLHDNSQRVSSGTLLIFRRTDCIITASGIVTLCVTKHAGVRSQLAYRTAVYRE